jgi:hypothetical protein
LDDRQCTALAPYCDTISGNCVECVASTNCSGADSVCNRETHRCAPRCATNDDCTQVDFPVCDPERNLCVECLLDESCPGRKAHCSETKTCVACLSNADCQAPHGVCDAETGTCVQCLTSQDCPGGAACTNGACAPK